MMHCERLFGMKRGREIRELIEAATGEPCPCQGIAPAACPLRTATDGQGSTCTGVREHVA